MNSHFRVHGCIYRRVNNSPDSAICIAIDSEFILVKCIRDEFVAAEQNRLGKKFFSQHFIANDV